MNNYMRISFTYFLLLFLFFSYNLQAKDFSPKKLGSIVALEDGRKKPLDTYAQNKLLQFSGKRKLKGKSAIEWFVSLIFNPQSCDFDPVFLINNPSTVQTLGITPKKRRRYSYAELSNVVETIERYYDYAIKKKTNEQTEFEKEIIRIYTNLLQYRMLAGAMSFLEPREDLRIFSVDSSQNVPSTLTEKTPSFLEVLKEHNFLTEQALKLRDKTDTLTQYERNMFSVLEVMYSIHQSIGNPPPHIIPLIYKGEEKWFSPWGLIAELKSGALKNEPLLLFLQIREAYLNRDQSLFDKTIDKFNRAVRDVNPKIKIPDPKIELIYNRLNPFFYAKILLGIMTIISLLILFFKNQPLYIISFCGIMLSFILATLGLILRIAIMRHPPVTNLFETFIFVGWASILLGIILEFIRIKPFGLLTASLCGFLFLHISGRYAAEGDTLGMLAAILNTGFWLTTHILTISLGYCGCIGASFLGHIYLLQELFFSNKKELQLKLKDALYGVFAFGMIFTVIGTVTGGMWADQAWGRFWGWDPKENGALLIIIWCVISFHAKASRLISEKGFAASAIIAAIFVMFTWLGVNLLGTGLHSYGFTSSGAVLLFSYTAIELLFIGIVGGWLLLKNKKRTRKINTEVKEKKVED